MSWASAIKSEQQHQEIIRLRGELERALDTIARLENKAAENDPKFWETQYHDSTSPYWMMDQSLISR